jgi:hypothetical protein
VLRPGPDELRRAVVLLAAAFVVPAALGLAALRAAPDPEPFPAAGKIQSAPAAAGVPQGPLSEKQHPEKQARPSPKDGTKEGGG